MDIDPELVSEIAEALEVTGVQLTAEQVLRLLEDEDELMEQLDEWGAEDTELLSQLANLLSQQLIGESWPTFGEERAGRDVDNFTVRLHTAARAAGYTLLPDTE